jgi:hypothetical protein
MPLLLKHTHTHTHIHTHSLTSIADAIGVEEEWGTRRELEARPSWFIIRGVELVATVYVYMYVCVCVYVITVIFKNDI